MTQKEDVVRAMERNGGYATFQQLNQIVDVSAWKTKTPEASIRRIVQVHPDLFFRIKRSDSMRKNGLFSMMHFSNNKFGKKRRILKKT